LGARLKPKKSLLDGKQMGRVIRRMANQLVELHRGAEDLVLVGIRTRGVPLAELLAAELEQLEGHPVPMGTLDITLYRDDLSTIAPQPVVRETSFPGPIDGRVLVLCDDVLYTGRTIRAALDALIDFGRPRVVQLAVLIDRGHRELPIQADVVGRTFATGSDEVIEVRFEATDGKDGVELMERVEES
jgi:pyrimidine operon attenuation protein/uracil phosphoribosyltransferase